MHVFLKGEKFGGCEYHPGSGNPFQGRVFGQVEEKDSPIDGTSLAKLRDKIIRLFEGDPHGTENNGEFLFPAENPGLPSDLGSKLIVGKPRA